MPVQDSLARGGSDQDATLGSTLFERHPDAVVVVDAAGGVQRANAAAQWLAREGMFPSLLDSVEGLSSLDAILPAQPSRHWRGPLHVRAGDGSTRAVEATLIPLTAEARDPLYCLCVLHEERQAQTRGDEYLALLAHDLRNPLAPIANAMGMLRLMERDTPALLNVRQIVERQLERLRRLATEISEAAHARQ